jgi:hypothetical protein
LVGGHYQSRIKTNLITVMQPEAKIQVTIKTKRSRMERPWPTAEKKEGSRDARK